VQKTLSALLARRALCRAGAGLAALGGRMPGDIGIDRRENGSVLMDDGQVRTNGVRQRRSQHCVSGE